jgi:hypothetical protein
MIEAMQNTLVIAGLTGLALLWVVAVVGSLQVAWTAAIEPLIDSIRGYKE